MQQLLALKYFGAYCFAFRVTCALNTHEFGIFWQFLVLKYSRECCLWLGEDVHWIPVKVKSFSCSWCTSGMIVIPPSEYLHSIQVKMTYFSSLMFWFHIPDSYEYDWTEISWTSFRICLQLQNETAECGKPCNVFVNKSICHWGITCLVLWWWMFRHISQIWKHCRIISQDE